MKVKEEYKGQTITLNDGILGMIKIDLNTIKPMQERRLIALGYTHLFEDEKVEAHEPGFVITTSKEVIDTINEQLIETEFTPPLKEEIENIIQVVQAPVNKTRKKKAQ